MKKNVDFLFRYEHKVRELESIMLLRMELERRGYSVEFVGNYEYDQKYVYHPHVFISPAIYTNDLLKNDWAKYGPLRKIANLQWEQLLGVKEEEDVNGFHTIKGVGQRLVNFCWGQNPHDRIVRGGVFPEMAPVVGNINTDLLRGDFRKLLFSKGQLAKQYFLNPDKKWYLFISSFAYCDMDDSQRWLCIEALGQDDFDTFTDLSYKSRDRILDWFEDYLQKNCDTVIIYRPHPDETEKCVRLKEMVQKYSHFRVISQEALKHWVNACDKVYNWFSTGIVDAILLHKPYRMLRPVRIPEHLDYRMMIAAKSISSQEGFMADVSDISIHDSIPNDQFCNYFYVPEKYVYQKVCDILEEMYKTNYFDIDYTIEERINICILYYKRRIAHFLSQLISYLPDSLKPVFIKERDVKKENARKVLLDGYTKNVATKEELNGICSRLKPIIYGK